MEIDQIEQIEHSSQNHDDDHPPPNPSTDDASFTRICFNAHLSVRATSSNEIEIDQIERIEHSSQNHDDDDHPPKPCTSDASFTRKRFNGHLSVRATSSNEIEVDQIERIEHSSQNHDDDHPPKPCTSDTSFTRTCFNGVNSLSGVGILTVPFAISQGGWCGSGLLLVIAIMCWYTGLLLNRCMNSDPVNMRTYSDIGEQAFGYRGRIFISIVTNLELFLVAVQFLILEGDSLNKLFPHMSFKISRFITVKGAKGFTFLSAMVFLPTTWLTDFSILAYISVGGILASIVLIACVLSVGTIDGVGFHGKGEILNWGGLPLTLSLFMFCYGGHSLFPTLKSSMRDKTQFPKVLLVSFISSTITYGSMGVIGYLMFGNRVMSQVTLNLPTEKIMSKLAIYTTIVTPLTKYAVVIHPIATTIEHMFPNLHNRALFNILIRTGLLIATLVVALTVPFFGYVMGFTGALLNVTVSLLLPCICYLKINSSGWRMMKSFGFEFVLIVGIIIVSSLIGISGTYISLKQIIISL